MDSSRQTLGAIAVAWRMHSRRILVFALALAVWAIAIFILWVQVGEMYASAGSVGPASAESEFATREENGVPNPDVF